MILSDADARFPLQLRHADGPRALYCSGNLALLARPLVAIVGSRDVAPEAALFAERLASAVSRMGIGVVSGGARGIDSAAHAGALLAGGAGTIVVLGVPLDAPHGEAARRMLSRLDLSRDLVVSEQPPGTSTRGHHFLERNRIIARLAHAVVIVRARVMSGALSTAGFAVAANRPIYAVPGSPWDDRAAGTNGLIERGARMLRTVGDLTEGLRAQFGLRGDHASDSAPFGDDRLEFLKTPRSVDELALAWRLTHPQVLRTLLQYELGGCVRRLDDGRFLCAVPM